MRFELSGKRVLVTGAASGMGRLFALRAAREGARELFLWDIDATGLERVRGEIANAQVYTQVVDVADPAAIRRASENVRARSPSLDLLINNAGIVRGKFFWEHDTRDIQLQMAINSLAPMHITAEFLPAMLQTGNPARILNIASAAGTIANPKMSVYAASKWAVIGWSDSLRLELTQNGHGHVRVTTFCPSYVNTGMFEGARGPLMTPLLTPEAAVEAAWNGMLRGQAFVMKPWTVVLGKVLRGLLPTALWDLVADRIFGVYTTMDAFKGRPGRGP